MAENTIEPNATLHVVRHAHAGRRATIADDAAIDAGGPLRDAGQRPTTT